jgi:hypothetical protein
VVPVSFVRLRCEAPEATHRNGAGRSPRTLVARTRLPLPRTEQRTGARGEGREGEDGLSQGSGY